MKIKRILELRIIILFFLIKTSTIAQNYFNVALHSEITQVQPFTGIVFWTTNQNAINTLDNKIQLEFSYLIYSNIVRQEGVYDWSSVDELLANVASNGHQAILRFRYTYPGVTTPSVPDYIRNLSNYQDQIDKIEDVDTYIPDWSNQELQNFTLDFFTKFAERYDNDPRLAFVQVGFGSYSEYHLYNGPLILGGTFPSKDFQTLFLEHLNNVFNQTQWAVSIDAASSQYSPIKDNANLLNLNYGLFDDSFLHETHSISDNEYNRSSWLTFGENRATTNVAGGELNYYSDWDQEHVLDEEGPYGFTFEEMASMYNITYMIGNDQLQYQTVNRIEEAAKATGYQFEVTKYETNGTDTKVTITNTGIAPIYYDAYPAIGNIKSNESLKGLSSGNTKVFTINTIATGEDLEIDCDRLVNGQQIQFKANIEGADTLSVSEFDSVTNVNVYPNPFSEYITVNNVENKNLDVKIFNMLGTLVYEKQFAASKSIDTSLLTKGVYVLQVKNDKYINVNLFVKE